MNPRNNLKRKSKKPFGVKHTGGGKRAIKQEYKVTPDKFLDDEEVELLFKNLARLKGLLPRNVLLIHLAIFTGARANEILNLRKRDILKGNVIHIEGLKGSNDRDLPIPSWLYQDLIEASLVCDAPDEFIFDIKYCQLRNIWRSMRPVAKKFHSLRHTFAIRLYKAERDILLVQQALGHKNLDCSLVYLKFTHSKESMARLVRPEDELRFA